MAIIDKPSDYFNTKLYTGNGTTDTSISGVGFQPDMSWFKGRTNTENHFLFDSIRGATVRLIPNGTSTEATAAQSMKSFDSDGFTLGSDADVNQNTINFVAWNWKAGTSFTNDASATGIGTIDSAGSVNTTSGFSIVSYTGTNANGTVGHGLGVAPKVIILKNRDTTNSWCVGHGSLGFDKFLNLNETAAAGSDATYRFQGTSPSSTVFSVGAAGETNGSSQEIIAYCFAEKQGYSKFGSYTGNGSTDGTFFYTGFKPAFTMIKSTGDDQWSIFDSKRNPFNEVDNNIRANSSAAEADQVGKEVDYLSNGVKLRTSSGEWNTSGTQYIYMAFAENPFVTSTGVPATAR